MARPCGYLPGGFPSPCWGLERSGGDPIERSMGCGIFGEYSNPVNRTAEEPDAAINQPDPPQSIHATQQTARLTRPSPPTSHTECCCPRRTVAPAKCAGFWESPG